MPTIPSQVFGNQPRSDELPEPEHDGSRESTNFPVVALGASAGGLDACRKLLAAMPSRLGMAFILVQHLDPTHDSMMVDLLADHTTMTVQQATEGMPIERDHLYIIPPGTYLSIAGDALHLSQPGARHGARLPYDFLLRSLAAECGSRAVCVILSGTGADGSIGLKSVKARGGLVIAQAPDDAGYDGMPRSAITTGAVDLVLPVAQIPDALASYARGLMTVGADDADPKTEVGHQVSEIIELLRTRTAHDFTLYKPGTLRRRIGRRMTMAGIAADDAGRYLALLRGDADELDRLAKDLLINVTGFFRDPTVFGLLAEKIIPDLVSGRSFDQPIRIWVAGCSTGEEAYSLAMLFHEQIAAAQRNVKLQVFASDVDPDAVASARDGFYPETIEADVSPERLARFFLKESRGYRVSPDLRSTVIFTVQDLLADPPFSRLDMISCRNLLIYLNPEAKEKILSIFHFALREGGILLLGSSETAGNLDDRFEVISKPDRLYRHIGRRRPGEFGLFVMNAGDGARAPARAGQQRQAPTRQAVLADLCRRLVMESYAPAAVLINRKHESLYSLGPTDRYLRVPPGYPTHDLLAMAPDGLRTKLRSAIHQAIQANARVVVAGGRGGHGRGAGSFNIAVQPVRNDGEDLLLICFVDAPKLADRRDRPATPGDALLVAQLEEELETTRSELQGAIRDLKISNEEQKAINEEMLSVQEEYQSANEELLTSKEELQSLNEELTALNGQLQETLEQQRTTANDLRNVLYSTDVATIFLDADLNIRFFTPATRSIFNVIPTDVGRPLADLSSLAGDGALLTDARAVLQTLSAIEREIEAQNGTWYVRRILPYRNQDDQVEGVVITLTDVTERRRAADALEAAKREAEQANVAKSRFLAAASHDLRQPLQTLALLQGLLAKVVEGEKAQRLVALLDPTLSAMSGMLNTLLDINQIEAGNIRAEMVDFPVDELLNRLNDEFSYHAQTRGLVLRVVPCSMAIHSDPLLLEQIIRNLLSNALKYTTRGKVLLGCRRHAGTLSIEVWDTGAGVPEGEVQAIFEEYHQLDNAARDRNRGLGLGLSIVRRLSDLLSHRIHVRSRLGHGSVFAVEVATTTGELAPRPLRRGKEAAAGVRRTGTVLVVEDDAETRQVIELYLKGEGHRVAVAPDGVVALEMVTRGTVRPDLILADYNLPNGMNGLELTAKLRGTALGKIPVIILTGDISTSTLRNISLQNCVQLNKPAKSGELTEAIQHLLSLPRPRPAPPHAEPPHAEPPVIFVVDDDDQVRAAIRCVLEDDGWVVEDYATSEAFLAAYHQGREACLVIDAYLPAMSGLDLLQRLHERGDRLPSIVITGNSDVRTAVQAMKAGASDFIEKPVAGSELLASIERAFEQSRDAAKESAWQAAAAERLGQLTRRQLQIMDLVLAGHPSKAIAWELGISRRTVESHRAAIMQRTGAASLPALARLALAAARTRPDPDPD